MIATRPPVVEEQQASIIEAKAALRRADESVKQGRAIMAFTLVTIFFVSNSLQDVLSRTQLTLPISSLWASSLPSLA